jgi:hypothetical protein
MNKQARKSHKKKDIQTSSLQKNLEYREFLNRLGIDPSDFDEPFEIEIDDYSR